MTIVGGTGRFQGATGEYTQDIRFSAPKELNPLTTPTCWRERSPLGAHRHQ